MLLHTDQYVPPTKSSLVAEKKIINKMIYCGYVWQAKAGDYLLSPHLEILQCQGTLIKK